MAPGAVHPSPTQEACLDYWSLIMKLESVCVQDQESGTDSDIQALKGFVQV